MVMEYHDSESSTGKELFPLLRMPYRIAGYLDVGE